MSTLVSDMIKFPEDGSFSHQDEEDHEEHEEDHDDEHGDEHEAELEYFDRDISTTSYALTLSRDITESLEVSLGLSSVERAPSAVELLMNGPHLATGRFEVGNFNLKSERADNIDLSFNYSNDGLYAALTFFQNNVDNYIYLMDELKRITQIMGMTTIMMVSPLPIIFSRMPNLRVMNLK